MIVTDNIRKVIETSISNGVLDPRLILRYATERLLIRQEYRQWYVSGDLDTDMAVETEIETVVLKEIHRQLAGN